LNDAQSGWNAAGHGGTIYLSGLVDIRLGTSFQVTWDAPNIPVAGKCTVTEIFDLLDDIRINCLGEGLGGGAQDRWDTAAGDVLTIVATPIATPVTS
jgi:hypothetical protein